MGKKILEDLAKILLTSFISILTLVLAGKRALYLKIDSKLDKTEYSKDQQDHATLHDAESKATEKQGRQIEWLYQNEISKKTYVIKPLGTN